MLEWVFAFGVITSFYEGYAYAGESYNKRFDADWLNKPPSRADVQKAALLDASKFLRALLGGYNWFFQPVTKVFWLAGTIARGTSSLAIVDHLSTISTPGGGYSTYFFGKSNQLIPCFYPVLTQGNQYPIDRPKLPELTDGYYLAHTNYLDRPYNAVYEKPIYVTNRRPPVKVKIKTAVINGDNQLIMSFQPISLRDQVMLRFSSGFGFSKNSAYENPWTEVTERFKEAQGTIKISSHISKEAADAAREFLNTENQDAVSVEKKVELMEFYIPREDNEEKSELKSDKPFSNFVKKHNLTFYKVSLLDHDQFNQFSPKDNQGTKLYAFSNFDNNCFQSLRAVLSNLENTWAGHKPATELELELKLELELDPELKSVLNLRRVKDLKALQEIPIKPDVADFLLRAVDSAKNAEAPEHDLNQLNGLYKRIHATTQFIRYEDQEQAATFTYHKIYTARPKVTFKKSLEYALYLVGNELYLNVWPLFFDYKGNIFNFLNALSVMDGVKALAEGAGLLAAPVIILIRLAIVPLNLLYYLALTLFVAKKMSNEPFDGQELFSKFHANLYVTNKQEYSLNSQSPYYPNMESQQKPPKFTKFMLFSAQVPDPQGVDQGLTRSFKPPRPEPATPISE